VAGVTESKPLLIPVWFRADLEAASTYDPGMSDDVQLVHESGVVGLVIAGMLAAAALIVVVAIGLVVWVGMAVADEVRERRARRRVQSRVVLR
jgi:hypothetical protein